MKDKNKSYNDYSAVEKFIISNIAIANTGYSLKEKKFVVMTIEEAIEIYEKRNNWGKQ